MANMSNLVSHVEMAKLHLINALRMLDIASSNLTVGYYPGNIFKEINNMINNSQSIVLGLAPSIIYIPNRIAGPEQTMMTGTYTYQEGQLTITDITDKGDVDDNDDVKDEDDIKDVECENTDDVKDVKDVKTVKDKDDMLHSNFISFTKSSDDTYDPSQVQETSSEDGDDSQIDEPYGYDLSLTQKCRWGNDCHRTICQYWHPWNGRIRCQYFAMAKCRNGGPECNDCPNGGHYYISDQKDLSKMLAYTKWCNYDENCRNPHCTYAHKCKNEELRCIDYALGKCLSANIEYVKEFNSHKCSKGWHTHELPVQSKFISV